MVSGEATSQMATCLGDFYERNQGIRDIRMEISLVTFYPDAVAVGTARDVEMESTSSGTRGNELHRQLFHRYGLLEDVSRSSARCLIQVIFFFMLLSMGAASWSTFRRSFDELHRRQFSSSQDAAVSWRSFSIQFRTFRM